MEGFTGLKISLDGDNAWPELAGVPFESGMATHLVVLPHGTASGKPSIAIRGKLENGTDVVLETTWNLLYVTAKAIEARYGPSR